MKIIKFIFGTIISIIALAIATKLAAIILGVVGFTIALVFLLLKLALVIAIAAFVIWVVSKLFSSKRQSESL